MATETQAHPEEHVLKHLQVHGVVYRRSGGIGFFAAYSATLLVIYLLAGTACALRASREGIPSQVQATIDEVTQDIANERYQQLYEGAADEWRRTNTLEESTAVFKTLKAKLGNVKNRSFHSATEQNQTGGQIPGHSFTISYQTAFERGEGMETFTLLEKAGRWTLAGYFVNSTALK